MRSNVLQSSTLHCSFLLPAHNCILLRCIASFCDRPFCYLQTILLHLNILQCSAVRNCATYVLNDTDKADVSPRHGVVLVRPQDVSPRHYDPQVVVVRHWPSGGWHLGGVFVYLHFLKCNLCVLYECMSQGCPSKPTARPPIEMICFSNSILICASCLLRPHLHGKCNSRHFFMHSWGQE